MPDSAVGRTHTAAGQPASPTADGDGLLGKKLGSFVFGALAFALVVPAPLGASDRHEAGAQLSLQSGPAAVKYVVVWKKVDGRWSLHRDIWNTKGA